MALEKTTIKEGIAAAFTQVMNQESDREEAIDKVADKIADTVISAIRSAEIIYTSGLVAPTGGGPVTGTLNHTIK